MSEPTTAGEVMLACIRRWDIRKDHIIPRCCLTGWEADLLIIKPSGWAEEVEIKVSKSDFRAEFRNKANKHEDLRLGGCRWVSKWGSTNLPPNDPRRVLRDGVEFVRDRPTLIRRFWFAMPKSLAQAVFDEVPAEYGVLACEGWTPEVLREPSALKPARKLTDGERIHALQSAYFRWWQDTLRDGAGLEHLIACPDQSFHCSEPAPVISDPVMVTRQLTLEVSA